MKQHLLVIKLNLIHCKFQNLTLVDVCFEGQDKLKDVEISLLRQRNISFCNFYLLQIINDDLLQRSVVCQLYSDIRIELEL